MAKWGWYRETYYGHMGWNPKTGKPLPETLEKLGLKDLIKDLN
jgi:aldehyde:ferredoxin oxidoreductase